MTNPDSRRAVDLDDLERQLRQRQSHQDAGRGDPLAELARIVGEDDPFRSVLGPEQPARRETEALNGSALRARAGSVPRRDPAPMPDSAGDSPYQASDGSEYAAGYAGDGYEDDGSDYAEGEVPGEARAGSTPLGHLEPQRSRKALVAVGAVLAVAVAGVAGALALRGGQPGAGTGAPPIIQADRNPLKVPPQNPGGADIPDQNKQIYDRRAPQGETRVVNREEQPVDVQQAARTAASESTASVSPSTATPGSGVAPPPGPASLNASLGEPKRVRTVAIKPDLGLTQDSARHGSAAPSASTTTPATGATSAPAPVPSRPRQEARAPVPPPTPVPSSPAPTPTRSTPSATASQPEDVTGATAQEARPGVKAPQHTAAIDPPAEKAAASGGFSVQLAVRPSDKEARAAFKELQQKYASELEGKSPVIRQADVNGKTVYRIRVGPLPREEANTLCTKLKSSGGQCFVAKD